MKQILSSVPLCVALAVSTLFVAVASGDTTAIGPFVGDLTEDFESFQNYVDNPDFYEAQPMSIFGGTALATTGSGSSIAIYEPNAGATFGLGPAGSAQVADGEKAFGLDEIGSIFIDFDQGITEFGGYWAATTSFSDPTTITFNFFDTGGGFIDTEIITYETNDAGVLLWAGWSSDTQIGSVEIFGEFVVADSLQANVPEPGTSLLLLTLGALTCGRRRR